VTDHAELIELAALYALGGLSPGERAELVEHVANGCSDCERALRANARVADELLLAVPPIEPSAAVRERLLARAQSDPAAGPIRRRRVALRAPLAVAATLVLAIGLAASTAVLYARLERETAARADIEEALRYEQDISWSLLRDARSEREQRVALEERLESASRIVAAIGSPVLRTLALAGQGDFRQAVAKAYLEPESGRLIVYAHNLPPVPDGRTYQLWVIVDKQPHSAGILRADAQGEAKYDTGPLQGLGGRVSVAVTLEPDGGVPQPSGPLVLAEG